MGEPSYVGQVFEDRYRILRLIGEGGMGSVYEAEHVVVGRHVAVKLLHPEMARDVQVVTRFYNEARAAGSIGNEHIIEILDFGRSPTPYLVMEYLEGRSLSQALEAEGPLGPGRASAIVLQVLAALEAAHAKDIVHRDLKPENVFLAMKDGRETVKLLDFGISKLKSTDPNTGRLTQTGTLLGTPYYMSPEQALGTKDLNQLTDLYSAGVILYECVTGKQPFSAENYNMLLVKIISESPPTPRSVRPDVPEALEHIILKAMAQDRPLRFQSAREFAAALGAFAEGRRTGVIALPASASATAERVAAARARILAGGDVVGSRGTGTEMAWDGTASEIAPPRRSRAVPLAVGATLAAVAVAAGAYFAFFRGGDEAKPPPVPAAPSLPTPDSRPSTPPVQAVPVAAGDQSVEATEVKISVAPPEAKIFIDGADARGNPTNRRYRRDGLDHTIRMAAPGYVEKSVAVTFDVPEVAFAETLEPVPAAPDVVTPPAAPADVGRPIRPRIDAGVRPPAVPVPPAVPDAQASPEDAAAEATRPPGFHEVDPSTTKTRPPAVPVEDNNPYHRQR